MSRLADDDPNRHEIEQVSRVTSREENQPDLEIPPDRDVAPRPHPLPETGTETTADSAGFTKWQTVIWREWSRCEDDGYAYYLFDLIKNTTFGWKFIVTMAVLGTMLGALAGYTIGAIMASGGLYFGPLNLSAFPPVILGLLMAITGGLIGVEGSRRFRALYFWWQGQPSASLVERSLQEAVTQRPAVKHIWAEPLQRLEQEKKRPPQPTQLIETLNSRNWGDRFVAQKTLVVIGGKAAQPLQEIAKDEANPLQKMSMWLLSCIEQETANKFAWRTDNTLCPHCLTRFEPQQIDVGVGVTFTCYGCRVCGQSRDYLYLPDGVVALLHNSANQKMVEKEGQLRVNWLVDRTLFDFDWVGIAQATDEEVERFAVQVGNDTDPFRRPHYRQMPCLIAAECQLSENTLRVLRHTFGKVKRQAK